MIRCKPFSWYLPLISLFFFVFAAPFANKCLNTILNYEFLNASCGDPCHILFFQFQLLHTKPLQPSPWWVRKPEIEDTISALQLPCTPIAQILSVWFYAHLIIISRACAPAPLEASETEPELPPRSVAVTPMRVVSCEVLPPNVQLPMLKLRMSSGLSCNPVLVPDLCRFWSAIKLS